MADGEFEFNEQDSNQEFATNGDEVEFAPEQEESTEFQETVDPEITAPGTEEDVNGSSEVQQPEDAGPPGDEEHENAEAEHGGEQSDEQSQSVSQSESGDPNQTDKKLFVGGLSWQTTTEQIKEHFEQYGEIENVDIKLDMEGNSRGFAFVQFKDPSMIEKVIKIPEHIISGKKVDPKPANPRGRRKVIEEEPMKKVFVGGITPEMDDDVIRGHFQQFGDVDAVERPRTTGPMKKKYLFVTFFEEEVAKKAIAKAKQTIAGVICDINRATPKQDFSQNRPYENRPWGQGYGGEHGGGRGGYHSGPPPRGHPGGRGRGGYGGGSYGPPQPYYDPNYSYDPNYGYDPNYYSGYDPSYYSGYDQSYYSQGYDPNYYNQYGSGYDWSYYGGAGGYDYSSYYPGQEGATGYDGGKAKRGAPASSGTGYHPYRKQ